MAKDKTKTGVPNKHLHARISYLQQAATYLVAREHAEVARANDPKPDGQPPPSEPSAEISKPSGPDASKFQQPSFGGLPLMLSSHLAQVARKSQIRLHSGIKHAICKRCNTPLIEGQTCTKAMENLSSGGRKPHADVLVLECTACGATKRWPVGATRQERKTKRKKRIDEAASKPEEVRGNIEGG